MKRNNPFLLFIFVIMATVSGIATVFSMAGCNNTYQQAQDDKLTKLNKSVASVKTDDANDKENETSKNESNNNDLIIFHAGSLSVPFKELSTLFKKQHPSVVIKSEAAGSRDTARKISDMDRPCDVLGSADYKVVENLLMPTHANFNIRFATNELAIAYSEKSKYADKITSDNWPEYMLKQDVAFGRADPHSDPCGYRSVMVFQLAQKFYNQKDLAQQLIDKDGKKYIRPKETDLLALLEVGEIDYLFIYESVAKQHGLKTIKLPNEINLKSAQHENLYKTAVVEISGKKPGETITRTGAPIVYSITIPKNAPNKKLALLYLELLLSSKGQAIMNKNGQAPIVPAITANLKDVPPILQKYCKQMQFKKQLSFCASKACFN